MRRALTGSQWAPLALDALFEGGHLIVGSISTVFLLARGLSLADVAVLKSVQGVVLLCGEVPTGVVADRLGSKASLLCALLSSMAGMLCFVWGQDLPVFLLAEVLCALALCFWSGAYESFVLERVDDAARYFHLNSSVNSLAILACGALGGWMGTVSLSLPYLASAGLLLIAAAFLWGLPAEGAKEATPRRGTWGDIVSSCKVIANHRVLWPLIGIGVAVQFAIQPLLHYWQPFFRTLSGTLEAGGLGGIFAIYCASQSAASALYYRYATKLKGSLQQRTMLAFGIAGSLYLMLPALRSLPLAILTFALLQGVLTVGRTIVSARLVTLLLRTSGRLS